MMSDVVQVQYIPGILLVPLYPFCVSPATVVLLTNVIELIFLCMCICMCVCTHAE